MLFNVMRFKYESRQRVISDQKVVEVVEVLKVVEVWWMSMESTIFVSHCERTPFNSLLRGTRC